MKQTNNPIVAEIGKLHFEGNIIPHEWYGHIKLKSGKTDLPAITILAEIVYWYRPVKELDEITGKPKPLCQKFTGDMFESGAAYYENKFGLTKDQARKALKRLEDMGYIRREYRDVIRNGVRYNNTMFVEPNPQKIAEITGYGNQILPSSNKEKPLPPSDTLSPPGDTLSPPGDTLSPPGDTFKTIKTNSKTSKKTNDRQTAKNENNEKVVRQSSVDLNFSYLNWPKNLNKARPVMAALTKLFDDYARQQVLDVVAKALEKGTIEKPIAFLQGVVKNYLNGDFTPIEKPLAQTSSQAVNYPDAQTQSRLDRIESQHNEEKMMDHLEQTFQQNRRDQVEKIIADWDDNTREVELADFRKNTGSTVRAQYTKLGLDSRLVKSALTEYVANKHLPIDENHFVTWAKKQGHKVEGSDTEGFQLNATKRIDNVLEKCVPQIDKNAQTRAKLAAMIGGFKQETEVTPA